MRKYKYLKSWEFWPFLQRWFPLAFVCRTYWREISRDNFLNAVRPYFFNSADEDVAVMYEHSPSLSINNGKNIFRVEVRGS